MKKVYEISTWRTDSEAAEMNRAAIEAAKQYEGKKFTVAIGEWGTKTYLVFADSKEEAKALALNEYKGGANKVKARDVTNSKKYN